MSRSRPSDFVRILSAALVLVGSPALGAASGPPDSACSDFTCGLPTSGAPQYLIIGTVVSVASTNDSAHLFERMRARQSWTSLPPSPERFTREIQTLVINAGDRTIAVNMSRAEMNAAPVAAGDFVRYAPHHGAFEKPPADPEAATYWSIDGCVAILCRAGDKECARRYVAGAFDHVSGAQLSTNPKRPLPRGRTIDVESLLPREPPTR